MQIKKQRGAGKREINGSGRRSGGENRPQRFLALNPPPESRPSAKAEREACPFVSRRSRRQRQPYRERFHRPSARRSAFISGNPAWTIFICAWRMSYRTRQSVRRSVLVSKRA